VEKREQTLRVPTGGAGMVAVSMGRERSAAREAGRRPAEREPEAAAVMVMAVATGGGVGAEVVVWVGST
jgi:hypothetical protein